MIKFRDYLIIQYKRIFKLLPGIVAMILVIAALLGAAGIALMLMVRVAKGLLPSSFHEKVRV